MGRPCTCTPCTVCGDGQCDCKCKNGPHLTRIDVYTIRQQLLDMSDKQRKELKQKLFGGLALLLCVLLVGCAVSSQEIAAAEAYCAPHGGLDYIPGQLGGNG